MVSKHCSEFDTMRSILAEHESQDCREGDELPLQSICRLVGSREILFEYISLYYSNLYLQNFYAISKFPTLQKTKVCDYNIVVIVTPERTLRYC
jgi:hypothetical protein